MQLESEETYELMQWDGEVFDGAKAKGISVIASKMTKCSFNGANLKQAFINDSTISKVVAIGLFSDEIRIFYTKLADCKFSQSQLVSGHIKDSGFKDCKMDGVNFHKTKFKSVSFENCNLDGSVLQEANLHDVTFRNCSFKKAELSNISIKKAVFIDCALEEANGLSSLRNAAVDYQTALKIAPSLMGQLGITIHEA